MALVSASGQGGRGLGDRGILAANKGLENLGTSSFLSYLPAPGAWEHENES